MAENLRTVDLNLLTVFDAVYEARNMSRAAERLGMSQPAISLALGRLRNLLGDPLFVRGGGAMQPTARAQQIASPIRSILDTAVSVLLRQPGFDYVTSERSFELSLGDYGSCVILPRLCEQLEELGARVKLHIATTSPESAQAALAAGSLDLLLSLYPLTDPLYRSAVVYTDTLSVLARHAHPLVREGMSIEQYCGLRHLIRDWPHGDVRPTEEILFAHGLRRREFVLVDSFLVVPAIIASTDAVATLPTRLAEHFAKTHDLRLCSPPGGAAEFPIFLYWRKAMDEDEGHRWLRELIAGLFRRL